MILEKLIKLAAKKFDIDPEILSVHTTFDDLGIDSLDMVELIMIIEDEFNIEVADEDVENFTTLGDVADYISDKI